MVFETAPVCVWKSSNQYNGDERYKEQKYHMHNTIIFDMDGTLYDTEKIYRAGWLHAGVPLDLYQKFIGTSSLFIYDLLKENGFDPDQIISSRTTYVESELSKGIPLKPGALESLTWLKENGWTSLIATSSTAETAYRYLKATDMEDLFSDIVSGNHLEHGKPAPDIFLMAAQMAGRTPAECIVVEDSFNGVRAGHAAGMYTIMVPDLVEPDAEMRKTADLILLSLTDLPACLQKMK